MENISPAKVPPAVTIITSSSVNEGSMTICTSPKMNDVMKTACAAEHRLRIIINKCPRNNTSSVMPAEIEMDTHVIKMPSWPVVVKDILCENGSIKLNRQ